MPASQAEATVRVNYSGASNMHWISLLVFAITTVAAAPAAGADKAPDGAALFRRHCQVCHGKTATDGEAGDIRGMAEKLVRSALRGVEQMPEFKFTDDEIKAITAHLASLDGG